MCEGQQVISDAAQILGTMSQSWHWWSFLVCVRVYTTIGLDKLLIYCHDGCYLWFNYLHFRYRLIHRQKGRFRLHFHFQGLLYIYFGDLNSGAHFILVRFLWVIQATFAWNWLCFLFCSFSRTPDLKALTYVMTVLYEHMAFPSFHSLNGFLRFERPEMTTAMLWYPLLLIYANTLKRHFLLMIKHYSIKSISCVVIKKE